MKLFNHSPVLIVFSTLIFTTSSLKKRKFKSPRFKKHSISKYFDPKTVQLKTPRGRAVLSKELEANKDPLYNHGISDKGMDEINEYRSIAKERGSSAKNHADAISTQLGSLRASRKQLGLNTTKQESNYITKFNDNLNELAKEAISLTADENEGKRKNEVNSKPAQQNLNGNSDVLIASKMSYGFFYDIRDLNWKRAISIAKDRQNNQHRPGASKHVEAPQFYQENWEPNFSCQFERRIGIMGDGGKWVCDPHRIKRLSKTRKTSSGKDDPCLVYSIGSEGDFSFEHGIMDTLGEDECEIHTFEVNKLSQITMKDNTAEGRRKTAKVNTHFGWGLISSQEEPKAGFKTLSDTIKELGHEGRTIDIFKIDCESCEWETYQDWIDAPALLHQVLVEVHYNTIHTDGFFNAMQDAGYVIFHKEPNIQYGGGQCVEYSFLKLSRSLR